MSGLGKEDVTGKTWSKLIAHVINHLEWEELADLGDEGMSDLLNVQDIIDKVQVATNLDEYENTDQTDEQDNLQKDVEALDFHYMRKRMPCMDLQTQTPFQSAAPL